MNIKCLIIDDEPSSQQVLKKYISNINFLELISVCNNANQAIKELKINSNIDLLFLDINMPIISGLTFYKSLQNPPKVIFTTAYSDYAINGFELNATDYLLKPFSFDRFLTAVNKLDIKKNKIAINDFIIIKSNKVLHKVLPNNIIFIEASGDYVKVHLEKECIVTNMTFTNFIESLPTNLFIRTHKSFAINLDVIKSISGNQIITNNHKIPIGQKYKSSFFEFLEKTSKSSIIS